MRNLTAINIKGYLVINLENHLNQYLDVGKVVIPMVFRYFLLEFHKSGALSCAYLQFNKHFI